MKERTPEKAKVDILEGIYPRLKILVLCDGNVKVVGTNIVSDKPCGSSVISSAETWPRRSRVACTELLNPFAMPVTSPGSTTAEAKEGRMR